ncbi:MAG: T9SS type A sorting domain-containing protein [Bacteroidetes bacterium]|nr:T9SS type A sorting domain-containing protein [Bacteroidota bacterium]
MNHVNLIPKDGYRFKDHLKNHVLLFAFLFLVVSVRAQNWTLTSNGDTHAVSAGTSPNDAGGQITLRSALEAATNIAGTHVITIPGSITAISLTLGQITVGSASLGNNITVNGPGKSVLTVTQTTVNRVFITGIGAVTFTLTDLTLNYTGSTGSTYSGGGGAILSGGVNANTTLTNVAINNFTQQSGNGGAILCSTSNTNTLTMTNCDFTGNKCGGGGGAVAYVGNSTCTITNCTFSNNLANAVGGVGGALTTSGSGTGTYSVTNCTFVNNMATSQGGAILNTNGALTANFCRFVGNTAASGNSIAQAGGASVQTTNSNNNWWGANAPAGSDNVVLAAGGSITCTKWMQLKLSPSSSSFCTGLGTTVTASFLTNSASEALTLANISTVIGKSITFVNPVLGTLSGAQATIQSSGTATVTYTAGGTGGSGSVNGVVDNVPGNDATAQAGITLLAAPTISASPSANTACAGLSASFSATVSNQTGVQWQESTTVGFGSPTTLSNSGIYSGVTTTTLTISDNSTVSGRYYRLVASNGNGCGAANSTGALLTATTPTLSANNTLTQAVGTANNIYYGASCGIMCKVVPSGASPVSGNVTSQVWVEASVPNVSGQPFVQRHYQITPASSPGTATATVTLYFSQTEFDNFNAAPGSTPKLPTGPADATGKANLRIGKYAGTSSGGGLPASYGSGAVVLDPPDANIVWNATYSRWEVSVDVTGFSGFFIQTHLVPLAVRLTSFTAQYNNNSAALQWIVAQPEDGSRFELQRSNDAITFNTINTQTGDFVKTQFTYTDPISVPGKWYYRLQITDKNGAVTYSDIVFVKAGGAGQDITVYPNPVKGGQDIRLNLQNVMASRVDLNAASGQLIWTSTDHITGTYRIQLPATIAKGVYYVKIYTGGTVETRKIMIE